MLVLVFRNSDNLAAACGFAVTGTMLTTSVLAFAVLPRGSTGAKRMLWLVALGLLLLFDVLLFSANVFKIHEGGWLPLVVAIVVFTLMMTWRRGRRLLSEMQQRDRQPLKEFMEQLEEYPPSRVHGTAIFMTMNSGNVPPALLHNLKHNKVLHDHVLFLTILVADVPYVSEDERFTVNKLSASSWQATVHYGFKEDPDVPDTLRQVAEAYRKSTWNRCVPRTSCRARPWSRPEASPVALAPRGVLLHGAQRHPQHQVLQDPGQPRRGNGHAGRAVAAPAQTKALGMPRGYRTRYRSPYPTHPIQGATFEAPHRGRAEPAAGRSDALRGSA